jgi:hypothetical protein
MAVVAGTGLLGACSGDGGLLGSNLTTSSLTNSTSTTGTPAQSTAKIDPACIALVAKIDSLRRDGVTERVEKASVGKSASVTVKRTSLAQITELDKANAEFQSKCSTLGLRPMTATAPTSSASPIITSSTTPAAKVATSSTTASPTALAPKASSPAATSSAVVPPVGTTTSPQP